MKRFFLHIIIAISSMTTWKINAQNDTKFVQTAEQVNYVFNRFHFNALPYDDSFSERIFLLFQKETDPYHSYLLKSQWDSLGIYKHTLDDELKGVNSGAFIKRFGMMYYSRWRLIKSLSEQVFAKAINYAVDEDYILEHKNSAAFQSEKEWENHWKKKLKFGILTKLGENVNSTPTTLPTPDAEAKARLFMQKIYKKRTSRILESQAICDQILFDVFFQCVVAAYDPHSMFIPADDKEGFDQELNAVQSTFGIEVDINEDGEFYVADVISGSAAWIDGVLKSGDILLRYVDEKNKQIEFIDLTDEDVYEMFYQPQRTSITLTVRAENDEEKTITLKREILKEEASIVKSWILKGEKNIGYISLPGFYFDQFGENPSGCANDVAKEILKMRSENVEGLILDVRSNGGGSFMEAVEMAGIFIQEGPLLYTWEKNDKPKATKDPNRGTIYDGPMVLMINGESASASEVLADILQDYNRALIVGTSSFGKATMQITVPLDSTIIKLAEVTNILHTPAKKTDYVNVTNGKLYRITGKTHQLYGVQPDITLPDLWESSYEKELNYDYTLSADTVKGSPYYKPLSPFLKDDLRAKSNTRTSEEYPFKEYTKFTSQVKKMSSREGQIFPLKWEKFITFQQKNKLQWDKIDSLDILANNSVYEVRNSAFNALQTMGNETISKGESEMQKAILGDAQLMETYRIILDLIKQYK